MTSIIYFKQDNINLLASISYLSKNNEIPPLISDTWIPILNNDWPVTIINNSVSPVSALVRDINMTNNIISSNVNTLVPKDIISGLVPKAINIFIIFNSTNIVCLIL